MLLYRSLSLFLSGTIVSAVRIPLHGGANGATSPVLSDREISASSIICGTTGTDKEKPAAYTGPHASSIQDCLSTCSRSNGCQSVAYDHSSSVCLLYKAPVTGNINAGVSQEYAFYDLGCPQSGSSSGGGLVVVVTTVVVIVPPATSSTWTSTLQVYVTITQGAASSSTNAPVIWTTSFAPPPPPLPASSLPAPTSTSLAPPPPPSPNGIYCNVAGWSAANTSFYDNSGNLANQDACELACKLVACGSYGFSNTACLVYPGSVAQSVVQDPTSGIWFFDAACNVTNT